MKRSPLLFGILVLVFPLSLQAQDAEAWAGLPLHFDTPGARSLAMGSTAVASSDDAAAGAVNPAAFAAVKKRTFAGEYRARTNSAQFGGSDIRSTQDGISSAMLVVPLQNVTWGVFFEEPIHADAQSVFVGGTPAPNSAYASVRLQRYGLTAATKRGRLAAGASIRHDELRLQDGLYFAAAGDPLLGSAQSFQRVRGGDFTWSAGVQWDASAALKLGATFATGAQYESLRQTYTTYPGDGFVVPSTFLYRFNTPASAAIGASFTGVPRLTLAADAVRIHYQDMTPYIAIASTPTVAFRDATEMHAGAEFQVTPLVALRAGWWRDPAHGPRQFAGFLIPGQPNGLQPDEEDDHVTAGVGIGSDRVRVDAAYDRGSRMRRASVGIATTF